MLPEPQSLLEHFFLFGGIPPEAYYGTYDIPLVVLSYIIASLGSFTGLRLATDIHKAQTEKLKFWLHIGGAFAFGAGIWSMHFIGMLAYDMDMVHTYEPFLTVVSMVIAVLIAYGVLQIIRSGKMNPLYLSIGAVLLGSAICGMHYTGMAAMEMDADLRYTPGLFVLSVLIAITASGAALFIVFMLGQHEGRGKFFWQVAAALIMGAAICGMHYTGMAASVFIPYADCRYDSDQSYGALATIVAIISSAVFAIALTLGLHNKTEEELSETRENKYSGNAVFLQLSLLLSFFLVLLVGSYFFFSNTISTQKNDGAVLNAASLQRMLLVRYTHHTSIIIAAHATKNWKEIARNNIAAQKDEKQIEAIYTGLLEGGTVVLSVDGAKILEAEAFTDENIRQALQAARKEWKELKRLAVTTLQADVKTIIDTPRYDELTSQLEKTLLAQDFAVKAVQHYIETKNQSLAFKQKVILGVGLLVFLLTVLFTRFFIANPIERARKDLKDSRDNLESRVQEQTLGLLEAKENAERLNRQMQGYTDKLEEARLEAFDAKDKAEEASRAKSDFLANMSHEIRTPLNAILGMSNFLLESKLNSDQKECANAIKTSGDTLLSIINDIIDISKIEAGKLILEKTNFDLLETLQEVISLYSFQAREKRLELIMEVAPDLPRHLMGDPVRIKQIFANLISNALKFTSEGHILIRVEKKAAEEKDQINVAFAVEDTGIGIPKDKQQKIFEKFSQAEESTTRKFGGTGLGLTIVTELIEMMGGSIGVDSEEGKGSTFKFNVILKEGQTEEKDVVLEDLSSLRVLVIDDYDMTRELLSSTLERREIANDSVASAEEALEVMEGSEEKYDACLIDYAMDGMNGLKLVEELRKKKKFDQMALVMVSGAMDRRPYEELKEIGLDGYFNKPFQSDQIIAAVKITTENRKNNKNDGPMITRHNATKVLNQDDADDSDIYRQYPDKKVLAVDDTKMNMLVIKRVLKKFGLQIETATNGIEALEAVKEDVYDAIFMDCQMPEMDGFEATKKIREFEEENNRTAVPIIALTADAMIGDREKCLSFGMNDYINKPFKEIEIADVLRKWTGGDKEEENINNVG